MAWKSHGGGFPLEFQLFAQRELRLAALENAAVQGGARMV
jgi:hypothetical protein